jgi:5-methylcytosine-specific restriction endonuclease McrA
MKPKKINGVEVWKDFEDLAQRLRLNVIERAVYSHLLRHTRLEGKLRQRFTMTELACRVGISRGPVRKAIRRLADHRILRLVDRSYGGHLMEVRLPAEVRATRRKMETRGPSKPPGEAHLEQRDFLTSQAPRKAIHAREGGKCFYCLWRVPARSRCLDHVVPCAKSGQNSYRNLVSYCVPCNWQKSDHKAEDFLRELYRDGRLSAKDLSARLRAVQELAAGKLRPCVFDGEDTGSKQSKGSTGG